MKILYIIIIIFLLCIPCNAKLVFDIDAVDNVDYHEYFRVDEYEDSYEIVLNKEYIIDVRETDNQLIYIMPKKDL